MQQRNFFTGEFCLANVDISDNKGGLFAMNGQNLQIMAYDPGKADTPHSIRFIGDAVIKGSDINRIWVSEAQLRKDPTQVGVRLPGMAP